MTNKELLLRIAGTVVGLLLAFFSALWTIFASPLRAGGVPLPVSPILAILAGGGLVWFTWRVTGRNGLALLPGVVWFGTMVVAASKTGEGDLLMPGNDYMGLIAILLGCAAWGLAGYRIVLSGRPTPPAATLGSPGTAAAKPAAAKPAVTVAKPAARPGKAAQADKPLPGGKPAQVAKPARGGRKPAQDAVELAEGGELAEAGEQGTGEAGAQPAVQGKPTGGKPVTAGRPANRRRPSRPSGR